MQLTEVKKTIKHLAGRSNLIRKVWGILLHTPLIFSSRLSLNRGETNSHFIPLCFAIIPQFYLSLAFDWLYGQNIIERKQHSKIYRFIDDKKLIKHVYNNVGSRDFNTYAALLPRKMIACEPVYEFINQKYSNQKNLRVLDLGCGDGTALFAMSRSLPDKEFEFIGFDPAADRIEAANMFFREHCSSNVKNYSFLVGTIEELIERICNSYFDLIICEGVITLLSITEFENMFHTIMSDMQFKYLLVSARMNFSSAVINGGTMPVYERIMKKYPNLREIKHYYWILRDQLFLLLLKAIVHPITFIKPNKYFRYKYILFEKLK